MSQGNIPDQIPFNKPFLSGNEIKYIGNAIESLKISGNGEFTRKCHAFFQSKYGFKKTLLTTSCTDALEMAALLLNIDQDDEIIVPSYTFVSTANAFALRGCKIVFADSMEDHPNMDVGKLESLITPKTRAIVPVHYAGIAVDMDPLLLLAEKYSLAIVEDAAQAIDSFYRGRPLGSIGELAAFSFHETKNIISGEGGMLAINQTKYADRAEILWEKGTNRASFFRGETDKYGWVDVGSSFLPSEITAAFLWAQLESLEVIQAKRKNIWNQYNEQLSSLQQAGKIKMPFIPDYATNNSHMFYIVTNSLEERSALILALKKENIHPVFHYLSLHDSPYFKDKHDGRQLVHSDKFTNQLVRLPFYNELSEQDIDRVCKQVQKFYGK